MALPLNDERIRWSTALPFVGIGTASIIAGGLVAAVTGPTDFAKGSWLAAFLVLVGGIAQQALGLGQSFLSARPPGPRVLTAEIITWNVGGAGVIAGSLLGAPLLTTLGGLVTAIALALFIRGVRHPNHELPDARALWAYRSIVLVLLVSTPIGLMLAWLRHT